MRSLTFYDITVNTIDEKLNSRFYEGLVYCNSFLVAIYERDLQHGHTIFSIVYKTNGDIEEIRSLALQVYGSYISDLDRFYEATIHEVVKKGYGHNGDTRRY